MFCAYTILAQRLTEIQLEEGTLAGWLLALVPSLSSFVYCEESSYHPVTFPITALAQQHSAGLMLLTKSK